MNVMNTVADVGEDGQGGSRKNSMFDAHRGAGGGEDRKQGR